MTERRPRPKAPILLSLAAEQGQGPLLIRGEVVYSIKDGSEDRRPAGFAVQFAGDEGDDDLIDSFLVAISRNSPWPEIIV